MSDKLETSIRRKNSLAVIQFNGDVTTFAEDMVQNAYREAVREGGLNLGLDFSSCEYINSAGIAVIIGVVTEARRHNRRIFVFGLTPHYQKIFRMVGLADYVEICTTEDEALERAGLKGA